MSKSEKETERVEVKHYELWVFKMCLQLLLVKCLHEELNFRWLKINSLFLFAACISDM